MSEYDIFILNSNLTALRDRLNVHIVITPFADGELVKYKWKVYVFGAHGIEGANYTIDNEIGFETYYFAADNAFRNIVRNEHISKHDIKELGLTINFRY